MTADPLVTPRLFDAILAASGNLVALETVDAEEAVAQFRQLALRSGRSIYLWDPVRGIRSLREPDVCVAGTQRLADALRYVLQSMHFGVYLFGGFADQLKPPGPVLLRRIARLRGGNARKLVLIGGPFDLPDDVHALFDRLPEIWRARLRPRLRDGRWMG
jgi:hypothetical protein